VVHGPYSWISVVRQGMEGDGWKDRERGDGRAGDGEVDSGREEANCAKGKRRVSWLHNDVLDRHVQDRDKIVSRRHFIRNHKSSLVK